MLRKLIQSSKFAKTSLKTRKKLNITIRTNEWFHFYLRKYVIIVTAAVPEISQTGDFEHSFKTSEIECKQQIYGSVLSFYSDKLRRTVYVTRTVITESKDSEDWFLETLRGYQYSPVIHQKSRFIVYAVRYTLQGWNIFFWDFLNSSTVSRRVLYKYIKAFNIQYPMNHGNLCLHQQNSFILAPQVDSFTEGQF